MTNVSLTPKRVIIIAGPNGAGKTTFARSFLPAISGCPRFINADLIAARLAPSSPESAAVKAARLMLAEVDACTARGESFAIETTLSGLIYLRRIRAWRRLGYYVELYFLSLPSADAAIARVALRVQQGGHNIPEAVIRRRFAAGLAHLEHDYRNAVDSWAVYDSSGKIPVLLELGENS